MPAVTKATGQIVGRTLVFDVEVVVIGDVVLVVVTWVEVDETPLTVLV